MLISPIHQLIKINSSFTLTKASLVAQLVKNLPAVQETLVRLLGWEYHPRRKWLPTSELLPGKSHGQKSLKGYSPWGRKVRHN